MAPLIGPPAWATPYADRLALLRRGVNITNWFRFPPSLAPIALRNYMSDAAIADLRLAGFSFVRLAVQPELLLRADGRIDAERVALLTEAVRRMERHGLAVVVELHPVSWHLERSEPDRAALLLIWRALATALRGFDARLTFPEILNEPVFTDDPAAWEALQARALAIIRAALPRHTVVLTGNEWGGIDGMLRLRPLADPNAVYSFHFYEPTLLTTLGEFQHGMDEAALAGLPFPVTDASACARSAAARTATAGADPTRGAVLAYCGDRWTADRVRARIRNARDWGARNGVAVVAGEFGARDRLGKAARLAWLRTVRQACEAEGIGWALWGYDDSFGLSVRRPPAPRPSLDGDVLLALGLEARAVRDGSVMPGAPP